MPLDGNTSEPETPEIELCATCDNSTVDCNCSHCDGCNKNTEEGLCSRCSECPSCCECSHCGRCNAAVEYTCSICERCDRCCHCSLCNNCGERVQHTCSGDSCESCCDGSCCNESESGPRRNFYLTFRTAKKTQLKLNKMPRVCGIELELSGLSDETSLQNWASIVGAGLVEDGSLPDSGVEIVTRPASGDILFNDCKSLGVALKKCGAQISTSCGLHVHVDARDYSQADLRRLIILYASVEQTIYELVSRSRFDNHYCEPSGKFYLEMLRNCDSVPKGFNKLWRKHLNSLLYEYDLPSRHIKQFKEDKYNAARYHGLNLHTYFFRKTIEFRMHDAHLDSDVFYNWALLCSYIVDKAYKMSEHELHRMIHKSDNSEQVFQQFIPSELMDWIQKRLTERREARREAGTDVDTLHKLANLTGPSFVLNQDVFKTSNKIGQTNLTFENTGDKLCVV